MAASAPRLPLPEKKNFSAYKGSFIEKELTAYAKFVEDMEGKVSNPTAKELLTDVRNIVERLNWFLSYFDQGDMFGKFSYITRIAPRFAILGYANIKPAMEIFKKYYVKQEMDSSKEIVDRIFYQLIVRACASLETYPGTLDEFAPFLNIKLVLEKLEDFTKEEPIEEKEYEAAQANMSADERVALAEHQKKMLEKQKKEKDEKKAEVSSSPDTATPEDELSKWLTLFPPSKRLFDEISPQIKEAENEANNFKAIAAVIPHFFDHALPFVKQLTLFVTLHLNHKRIRAAKTLDELDKLQKEVEVAIAQLDQELAFFATRKGLQIVKHGSMYAQNANNLGALAGNFNKTIYFQKSMYHMQLRTIIQAKQTMKDKSSIKTKPETAVPATFSSFNTSMLFQFITHMRSTVTASFSSQPTDEQARLQFELHYSMLDTLDAYTELLGLFDAGRIPTSLELPRIIYLVTVIDAHTKVLARTHQLLPIVDVGHTSPLAATFSQLHSESATFFRDHLSELNLASLLPFLNAKDLLKQLIAVFLPLAQTAGFDPIPLTTLAPKQLIDAANVSRFTTSYQQRNIEDMAESLLIAADQALIRDRSLLCRGFFAPDENRGEHDSERAPFSGSAFKSFK